MKEEEAGWERVAAALAAHWDFPVTGHDRLDGRNARTWQVPGPAGNAVAKLVGPGDAGLAQFERSLRVAAMLDNDDLPTAPPLPSRGGPPVVPVGSGRLAHLPWLGDRPLSGTRQADLGRMGAVLATLHQPAATITIPAGIPAW